LSFNFSTVCVAKLSSLVCRIMTYIFISRVFSQKERPRRAFLILFQLVNNNIQKG
jgi:hypothetical protein